MRIFSRGRIATITGASIATGAALLGVGTSPATAHIARHHHHRPPFQQLVPLAGSGSDSHLVAVFARYQTHRTHSGDIRRANRARLLAVGSDGHVRDLGRITSDFYDFSLSGDFLTATSHKHPGTVYWWGVSPHHQHGTGTVDDGDTYQAAAPDGWVEANATGSLFDKSAYTGDSRLIGQPFPSLPDAPLHVVAGPTGWVASNRTAAAFLAQDEETGMTVLDTSTTWHQSDAYIDCFSASETAAACATVRGPHPSKHVSNYNNFLAPLDGGAQLEQSQFCANPPAALASEMAWECTQPALGRPSKQVGLVAAIDRQRYLLPKRVGVGPMPPVVVGNEFVTTNLAETKAIAISADLRDHRAYLPRVRSSR
jgi:hypothetical protein